MRLNQYVTGSKQMIVESYYLNEAPMRHLEHFEDNVINKGLVGLNQDIKIIRSIVSKLNGESEKDVSIRTKWDGAPDVISGYDTDGHFFVSTKSAFNKNPKLAYTDKDIDELFDGPDLKEKLKYCLQYLPEVIDRGIFQVSLMFTDKDIKIQVLNGERCMTFTPNTLTYAVPDDDSDLAKEVRRAKLGIVAHATYKNGDLSNAALNAEKSMFKSSPNVWVQDSSLKDVSGVVNFEPQEANDIEIKTLELERLAGKMGQTFFIEMEKLGLNEMYKTWTNSLVRVGTVVRSPEDANELFIKFVMDRLQKDIDIVKTVQSKEKKKTVLDNIVSFFKKYYERFIILFDATQILVEIKQTILDKLNQIKTLGTFMMHGDDYKVVPAEGFVVIDNDGSIIKLVSRMDFSRENLNNPKFR